MKSLLAYLQGGLGNQCFIYATARAAALRGVAKMSVSCDYLLEDRVYKRKLALDVFNCTLDVCSPRPRVFRLAQKLRYRLLRDHIVRWGNYCVDKRPFCYRPLPCDWRGTLTLDGYWQSEKYFYDKRDQLLHDFKLKDDAWVKEDPVARQILEAGSSSAFIHVRSYKEVPGREDGSCAKSMVAYYQKTIRYLQGRVPGLRLFLFSDDPPFARSLLAAAEGGVHLISTDNPGSPILGQVRDFSLMRMCRHGIVADSSFSWWAGWLGEQEALARGERPIRVRVNRTVMNQDFWPDRWIAL